MSEAIAPHSVIKFESFKGKNVNTFEEVDPEDDDDNKRCDVTEQTVDIVESNVDVADSQNRLRVLKNIDEIEKIAKDTKKTSKVRLSIRIQEHNENELHEESKTVIEKETPETDFGNIPLHAVHRGDCDDVQLEAAESSEVEITDTNLGVVKYTDTDGLPCKDKVESSVMSATFNYFKDKAFSHSKNDNSASSGEKLKPYSTCSKPNEGSINSDEEISKYSFLDLLCEVQLMHVSLFCFKHSIDCCKLQQDPL